MGMKSGKQKYFKEKTSNQFLKIITTIIECQSSI
jgi:hypothetical protein